MTTPTQTTTADQPADDACGAQEPPSLATTAPDLMTAAARPDVDPCDVACDAMPAHLAHDLSHPEVDWLLDHTATCTFCSTELGRYRRLDDALAQLDCFPLPAAGPATLTPPRFVPPGTRPARPASYGRVDSPLGPLFVAATDAGLCEIGFAQNEPETDFRQRLAARGFDPTPLPATRPNGGEPAVDRAARELAEYFGGSRERFDLPLDWTGVTPFTRAVLEATAEVPFGRLATYRDIAHRIGRPGATRAVGNALGRNPIPVVVPCHRIVRSGGALGGYTGGTHIKQHLLALEGSALV